MQTRAVLVGLIGSAIRALSDHCGSSRCVQQLGLRVNATYATIACFPEFPGRNRDLYLGAAISLGELKLKNVDFIDFHEKAFKFKMKFISSV